MRPSVGMPGRAFYQTEVNRTTVTTAALDQPQPVLTRNTLEVSGGPPTSTPTVAISHRHDICTPRVGEWFAQYKLQRRVKMRQ